ncbi:hypothetical protein AAC387_Pa01g2210 [Persea americana]
MKRLSTLYPYPVTPPPPRTQPTSPPSFSSSSSSSLSAQSLPWGLNLGRLIRCGCGRERKREGDRKQEREKGVGDERRGGRGNRWASAADVAGAKGGGCKLERMMGKGRRMEGMVVKGRREEREV